MKKIISFVLFLFAISNTTFSQTDPLNVSFVGNLAYDVELSDIWGYQAPDGTEYALVGTNNGFSIVSLADPANPTEVQFIPGATSVWRDIKTFGTHAYITTDEGNDGLLVVDMAGLPNSIDSYYWKPNLLNQGTLSTCHNLYVDELGWMYLAGCSSNGNRINNGGVLIFDVFTDSFNPVFVGNTTAQYAHDVYTKDDLLYSSNLTNGLRIFDITDRANPVLEAVQPTAFDFTHNAWSTDDNSYVFTTDELADAPVGSYDVTDLDDVKELDLFRPTTTLGEGVIPHNVQVLGNYIIVSYYSDGCIVIDATHPDNLIEVGNYDTFIPTTTGFSGAWGAYPYLPSGLILISDIESGLYVLQPDYQQACYLEGTVTEINTNTALNDVKITINSGAPNLDYTTPLGTYKTGQVIAGDFEVTFMKLGYRDLVTTATFVNGEITFLDVQMTPLDILSITGITLKDADGEVLSNAGVVATSNQGQVYRTTSDADGTFGFNDVFEGEYQFFAGKWGYLHTNQINTIDVDNNTLTIDLKVGYKDDFFFDAGWTEDGEATTGNWELGEPVGTNFEGQTSNTNEDVEDDLGEQCYVTGNGGGSAGTDDIDGGTTRLTSPLMDLTTYNQPIVSFQTWFFNDGGSAGETPNDDLVISVTNGTETIMLDSITESLGEWRPTSSFILSDLIEITDSMQIIFAAQDRPGGHLVEAAVDAFLVTDGMPTATNSPFEALASFQAFPNPFGETITLDFEFDSNFKTAQIRVFNLLGQLVETQPMNPTTEKIEVGQNWQEGVYFISLEVEGRTAQTIKVMKQ